MEEFNRIRTMVQSVSTGVKALSLPIVDFPQMDELLLRMGQENVAQV